MHFRRIRRWLVAALLALAALVTAAFGVYEWLGLVHVRAAPPDQFTVGSEDITLFPLGADLLSLQLHWKNAEGKPYGSCEALVQALELQGKRVRLVMNAGIFREAPEGVRPLGLHVQDGQTLAPLNATREAYGNFYMQPNGVFWWTAESAGIDPTERYATKGLEPTNAVQSGPMLLVDGVVNAAFAEDSRNRLPRAGVGVTVAGEAMLGFAQEPVTLFEFAEAFRRHGCDDALYLDGAIVGLYADGKMVNMDQHAAAAMLAIVE